MLDQGVWAEVRVGDEHLRLFSEHNAQGKDRAAAHARAYLHNAGRLELPPLEWKKSRSA